MLQLFDIPHDLLVASPENPNEQDDTTFDQVLEGMKRDGFDENIIVVPYVGADPALQGKYIIVSGHHRAKAAKMLGLPGVPSKIHSNWDDMKRKLELVRRNQLRGSVNPQKFTKLYDEVIKTGLDASVVKMQMGITNDKAFQHLYKAVSANLPPAAKKKLDEAKETITSVDDLSGVISQIMKEHGSDLAHGFLIFSRGGKDHMKVDMTPELWAKLQSAATQCRGDNTKMGQLIVAGLEKVVAASLPSKVPLKKGK